MQYRKDRLGQDLSILGFGCMRFTKKGNSIDLDKAESEILAAYRTGINYYDTAYLYPGSEQALGTILQRNGIREKVYIATKLPQFMVNSSESIERFFQEELKRLQTDYVDFYLIHHLTDKAQWDKLVSLGIIEWIEKKKASGIIRQIGFSFHGNTERFLEILRSYDWDFCQIQYNYMDEVSQAGAEGLHAAAERGIPVMIMEPLRGGKLVGLLPDSAKKLIAAHPRCWTPAEWSFRWLYNQPEVTVVLSGMNSLEMVSENVNTASSAEVNSFTQEDFDFLATLRRQILASEKVPCTGCRYCMPCPKGVDIPGIFRTYNTMYTESSWEGRFQFAQTVGLTRNPAFATQCVGCGKCESHCPQMIPIREKLKEADRALRPLPIKVGLNVVRRFMFRGTH